jgi:hypothetical protein
LVFRVRGAARLVAGDVARGDDVVDELGLEAGEGLALGEPFWMKPGSFTACRVSEPLRRSEG